MIYENIQGWFTYAELFDMMIEKHDNAIFVEIGAWKGKSAVYMGESIKTSGKNIMYYVIDHFKGNPESPAHKIDPDIINNTLYDTFIKNISPVSEYIRVIKADSKEACIYFSLKQIDFLFIDGSHTYDAVKQDILLWTPKVKGVIAGHDYFFPGVNKAVKEYFPKHKVIGDSWYVEN